MASFAGTLASGAINQDRRGPWPPRTHASGWILLDYQAHSVAGREKETPPPLPLSSRSVWSGNSFRGHVASFSEWFRTHALMCEKSSYCFSEQIIVCVDELRNVLHMEHLFFFFGLAKNAKMMPTESEALSKREIWNICVNERKHPPLRSRNIHKWFLLALVVVVFQWQPLTSRGQCSYAS